MKLMTFALAAALVALNSPTVAASNQGEASGEQFLMCEYAPTALVLTCWDSAKVRVYSAVPFDKVLGEGWELMQAYAADKGHYWLLKRKVQAPG